MTWSKYYQRYVAWINNRADKRRLGRTRSEVREERLSTHDLEWFRHHCVAALSLRFGDPGLAEKFFLELSQEPNGPDLSPFPVMPEDDLYAMYRWDSETVGDRLEEYLTATNSEWKVSWKDIFAVEESVTTVADFASAYHSIRAKLLLQKASVAAKHL